MRKVFFAGLVLAGVYLATNLAIRLLNRPDDTAVTAGYFVLLALVSILAGWLYRIGRRI